MAAKTINIRTLDMSKVGGKSKSNVKVIPDNKSLIQTNEGQTDNMRLLQLCSTDWSNLQTWRDKTERAWRYVKGRQWDDLVYDPDSDGYVREKQLIMNQGQVPFVYNMIAPLLGNLVGQFIKSRARSTVVARTQDDAPLSDMLSDTLWACQDANKMWMKDKNALLLYFSSGCVIQRLDYGKIPRKQRMDAKYKNVEFTDVFFNQIKDQDYEDLTRIGRFYDMPVNSIVAAFANSKKDEAAIRDFYSDVDNDTVNSDAHFTDDSALNREFYSTGSADKGRVYETWEKKLEWRYVSRDYAKGTFDPDGVKKTVENKLKFDLENQARIDMAREYGIEEPALIEYSVKPVEFWYFKYITPDHQTLLEGESPFNHKSHPYMLLFDSFIRGESQSFVDGLIDIQRGFNRDKILLDFVVGASAKGTLLIDEDILGDDFDIDDAVDEYTKRNGVIKIKINKGQKISEHMQQLVSKAVPAGLNESLSLGLQLMNQIGGVSDAMQGRNPSSGTPAALYAQSAQNSTLNSAYRMDDFNRFRSERDEMLLKICIQFYKEKRYLAVSASSAMKHKEFDPEMLPEELEYAMNVGQGSDSQMYRAIMDDWINQYITQGIIPLKVGLKHLSFPNIDKLVNDLEEFEQNNMNGGAEGLQGLGNQPDIAKGLVEGMQQGGADETQADPKAMELMKRYAGVA